MPEPASQLIEEWHNWQLSAVYTIAFIYVVHFRFANKDHPELVDYLVLEINNNCNKEFLSIVIE